MKKEVRLYNVLFPIWLFWLLPTVLWLIILPANFMIDSLILILALKKQKISGCLQIWKQSILKIWIIGFFSDLIGAGLICGFMLLIDSLAPSWDTLYFPGTTLISIPGVILAGLLIYWLNKRFSFIKCGWSKIRIHNTSLILAVFSAPYAMLIPLYG